MNQSAGLTGSGGPHRRVSRLEAGFRDWADYGPLVARISDFHTWVYRVTGGRIGHRVVPGKPPFLLLDHVGARSGILRTSPLVYVKDGSDLIAQQAERPRLWRLAVSARADFEIYQARTCRTIPLVVLQPRAAP